MDQIRSKSFSTFLGLANQVFRAQYFQPAVAFWRVFETDVVLQNMRAQGRGLDLGCGDGRLAKVLFSTTPDVRWTGLDIDAEDIKLAQSQGVYEKIHLAAGDKIPEPNNAFDIVFSNSVLEHIPDLGPVITEVARVLKPGGKFVFTVPKGDFCDQLFWSRALRALGMEATSRRYIDYLNRRLAHINYFSPAEWTELLAKNGFETTNEIHYLSRRVTGWWETMSNSTGGLVYLLKGQRDKTLREVQHSAGMLVKERRWLGTLELALLLPLLAFTYSQGPVRDHACLYMEGVLKK